MKLVIFIWLLIAWQIGHANVSLTAKITSEKSTYLIGESIPIVIIITNPLDTIISYSTYQFAKHFVIKDQNNKQLKLNINSSSESRIYLIPGDSIKNVYNITSLFGRLKVDSEHEHYGFSNGEYSVQFRLQEDDIKIESNLLFLKIIPPPVEEEAAFKLYNQAWTGWFFSNSSKKSNERIKSEFLKVVEQFPKSIYTPASIRFAQTADYQNKNYYNQKLIQEYPHSYEVWYAINSMIVDYQFRQDKIGVENFLSSIVVEFPGTFAAQDARNRLEKIQQLNVEEWLNPELVTQRKLREYQEQQQKR